ncbi:MAG: DUF3098 domain-containing protein [Bacteroidales bacterium]|nr:DUF3098 domain-containing protein [Bacteroidales bacterium]
MATKQSYTTKPQKQELIKEERGNYPLTRINFIMMAIAGAAIVVGFLLMLGPKTTAAGFEPDIFSTRRIVIGPALSFLGFAFMGFAIIYRSHKENQNK